MVGAARSWDSGMTLIYYIALAGSAACLTLAVSVGSWFFAFAAAVLYLLADGVHRTWDQ